MTKPQPAQWASKIWNDEDGEVSIADVPADIRDEVEELLRAKSAHNAEWCASVAAMFAPREVNGVLYESLAEATVVRQILERCGIAGHYPGTREASAAINDESHIDLWSQFPCVDMGSLDPIDIGFDARETPIQIPEPPSDGFVRARLPRSRKYPRGKLVHAPSRHRMALALKEAGFATAN